jgi:hypothetical protein
MWGLRVLSNRPKLVWRQHELALFALIDYGLAVRSWSSGQIKGEVSRLRDRGFLASNGKRQ